MRHVITVIFCAFVPFLAAAQGSNMGFFTKEIVEIPKDYNAETFKSEKKETVRLLREYLESKDRELDDVNLKVIAVNNDISRSQIDTALATKYQHELVGLARNAAITDEIKRCLKELGFGAELEGNKTIAELEPATNQITARVKEYLNDKEALAKLHTSTVNIKFDISQAHKRVDELYGSLYDEGRFRIWITGIFSLIVGALLLFFFYFITRKSESAMAKDFLSSGNGLQFITLFSLITAIILFGVLGILEGRELAAILSGISGYILGKGINTQKNAPAPRSEDHRPPAPPLPASDPKPQVTEMN